MKHLLSVILSAVLTAMSLTINAQVIWPDLVLYNGKIITLDEQNTVAEAVAISGNRIFAVGSSSEIEEVAGEDTTLIDLEGQTVIPGLIDSHAHSIRSGIRYPTEVNWEDADSLAEALELMRQFARTLPDDAWVVVTSGFHGGWHPAQFRENRMPTAQEIHEAAGGRPAYVRPAMNTAIVTPHGLELLGIETDADLPLGGTLELNSAGRPSGVVNSDNVFSLVAILSKIPRLETTFDQKVEGSKEYIRELNALGMTGVIDAGGMTMTPVDYRPIFELWRNEELNIRIAYHFMSQERGAEFEDIKSVSQMLVQGYGDDVLKFNGIGEVVNWAMSDGAVTLPEFNPSEEDRAAFLEAVKWVAQEGYTAKIHSSSDAAAEILLDLIEQVNEEIPIRDLRWSLEHLNNPSDETLSRMKALGMIHGIQNLTYYSGPEMIENLGEAQARLTPPIRTILDSGVVAAIGTDTPEVPKNLWLAIKWLLDGRSIDGTQIHGTDQLATREEALRLATIQGAFMSFDEDRRGSIEVGKLADLAVLNKDYMNVDVEEVADIESLLTIMDGRIVHASGDFSGLALTN